MKQGENKPRSGSVRVKLSKAQVKAESTVTKRPGAAKRKIPARKKKKKKLETVDKIRAVLVAAVLILITAVSSLAVLYFHSVRTENEKFAAENVPSEKAPDPPGADVLPLSGKVESEEPLAAENTPSVNAVPLGEFAEQSANIPPAAVPRNAARPPEADTRPALNTPPVNTAPQPAARPSTANIVPEAESRPLSVPNQVRPAPESRPVPAPAITQAVIPAAPERSLYMGSLVIVIDDAGHNIRDLEPFLKFPGPLSIAVLPGLPYSAEAARRIRAAGKEVLLHQPMEPLGGQNPGPGAVRSGMSRDEIRAVINRNLDELWPVAGLNNHEGSRITMDDEAMDVVLELCRERGIFFLDSRTTADTAAPRAARRIGMVIGERDVFIDNVQERDSMLDYINTGLKKAEQKGSAIMIGHVWSPALAPLLAELYPDLGKAGFSFSSVSKIIGGGNQ